MPIWISTLFQDRNSPIIEKISFFHDHRIVVIIFITILTFYLIFSICNTRLFNKFMLEEEATERGWTILPSLALIFIAIPSIKTLYITEDSTSPSISIKVTGHQWYWSYEIPPISEEDCFLAQFKVSRLLISDPSVTLPTKCSTRLLVSSSDVIHSWALPRIGVKIDAIPGRLNQSFMIIKRPGLTSGQCSEICGANHSFIPILIKTI